jgi:trans-2,3-dihydro-3-hydroxyanthranilate isomerase
MRQLGFRIVNVFTMGEDRLSGNPLCVFEDGSILSDAEMAGLARQMNLSETTFVLPAETPGAATARVRVFTPSFELPFAGHPTLGTAHVVSELHGAGAGARDRDRDRVVLDMKVGPVEVRRAGRAWTLRTARPPETRPAEAGPAALAEMLGVRPQAVTERPMWVNTGVEQLVIPLAAVDDVAGARPDARLMARHAVNQRTDASMAYVWARAAGAEVVARFFFLSNGSALEDPATGSACANLGGYLIATGAQLPVSLRVRQGDAVGRPSSLSLRVDEQHNVFVSGEVIELGRGVLGL